VRHSRAREASVEKRVSRSCQFSGKFLKFGNGGKVVPAGKVVLSGTVGPNQISFCGVLRFLAFLWNTQAVFS